MLKKVKILYFHTGRSSFVDKDRKIFLELGEVFDFSFSSSSKLLTPLLFIRQLFFIIKYLPNTRIFVCQFAGYHSFLPGIIARLTGKKLLIISGGTDCVSYPTIRYGNFYKRVLRVFTTWSYKLAHHIAPKHESLWFHDYIYDEAAKSKQGIAAFLPGLTTPHTSIPNGYDIDFWTCENHEQRSKFRLITVSSGFDYPFQKQLKGVDLILEVAPKLPQFEFVIIGVDNKESFGQVAKNVELLPSMSAFELRNNYCRSGFYLQLSMAEGFPNALCEAMLCGCIPIGSAVYSIPEIIGKNGYQLLKRDSNELINLLKQAVENFDWETGNSASKSIAERFPLSRRKQELIALCNTLL